ncbi:MAG: hypothetical protein ACHWZW_13990 [Spirulina sp.]
MVDPTVLDQFIEALRAYGQAYGMPSTLDRWQGIAATLLRLMQEGRTQPLSADQVTDLLAQSTALWDAPDPTFPRSPGEIDTDSRPTHASAMDSLAAAEHLGDLNNPETLARTAHRWHHHLQLTSSV